MLIYSYILLKFLFTLGKLWYILCIHHIKTQQHTVLYDVSTIFLKAIIHICLYLNIGDDDVDKKKGGKKKMITANKKETQKTIIANDDVVMRAAKKGMKKYRKTLDKLAKN